MAVLPFLALINTEHIHSADRVTDHLDDSATLARLTARWGFDTPVGPEAATCLKALRATLRDAAEEVMRTGTLGLERLASLNAVLAGSTRRVVLARDEDGSFQLLEHWDDPAALAAASFARFLAEDDPRRLKLCSNPHCRWAFRDESKNRSRRWCSAEACGNVAKLRAYRSRARQRRGAGVGAP